MASFITCLSPLKRFNIFGKNSDKKISKPTPAALPLIPPDFDDETSTSEKVSKMLNKAEEYFTAHKYREYIEVLEQTVQLGSAKAAAKLALAHHTGIPSIIPQDYAVACAYYFNSLKYIYMIPCNQWEMTLLLDVIAGLSDIYRFHMNRKRDEEIWNCGVKAMEHIQQTLQDPMCTKFLTHQDIQKRRAVRVHITYCLGITAEADKDYSKALEYFFMCYRFGESGFATADKLVKKAQSKIKALEPRVPKVKPICCKCNFEPKSKEELWGLLVCPKCLLACCSPECMAEHKKETHS